LGRQRRRQCRRDEKGRRSAARRRFAAVMRIDNAYVGSGVAMGFTGSRKPTPTRLIRDHGAEPYWEPGERDVAWFWPRNDARRPDCGALARRVALIVARMTGKRRPRHGHADAQSE